MMFAWPAFVDAGLPFDFFFSFFFSTGIFFNISLSRYHAHSPPPTPCSPSLLIGKWTRAGFPAIIDFNPFAQVNNILPDMNMFKYTNKYPAMYDINTRYDKTGMLSATAKN